VVKMSNQVAAADPLRGQQSLIVRRLNEGRFVKWLEPWYSIADDDAQVSGMERELRRELAPGHALFAVPVTAIGRRCDCDDVIYSIEDGTARVAVVHLTWNQNPPDPPPWPDTLLYESIDRWMIEGMRPDHEDYVGPLSEPESGAT
jgi:hypothetical protein